MINLSDLNDEFFEIVHLTKNEDLSDFSAEKGYGLEVYLKKYALLDEEIKMSRTYLIKDIRTKQIVAYFTLRSGLITVSRGLLKGFDAYTGIELANFAVNDNYRKVNNMVAHLGSYVFYQFILPLTLEIAEYVGASYLYIFSLPKDKLMAHYETMGFVHTSEKMRRFVYSHIKPAYDKGCVFMWQKL
ncbi:MAG: hypothetical protein J6A75_13625 [Lachnospiraceae bacterium]|nr:hypothetical protein [Lachnospiraceae bacterium]